MSIKNVILYTFVIGAAFASSVMMAHNFGNTRVDKENSRETYRDVNPTNEVVKGVFEIAAGLTVVGTAAMVGALVGGVGGMVAGAFKGYSEADSAGAALGLIVGGVGGAAAGGTAGTFTGLALLKVLCDNSSKK